MDKNGVWRRLDVRDFIVYAVQLIYSEDDYTRRLRWAGHVARMEEGMTAFNILTRKHKGKGPLGRPRRR